MQESGVYRTESGMIFRVSEDAEGHLSVWILEEAVWVEARIGVVGDSSRFVPTTTQIPSAIALHSASKAFNLAGLRAAVAVPGPDAVADLARLPAVVAHGVMHLGALAQQTAYREAGAWLDEVLDGLRHNQTDPRSAPRGPASSVSTWPPRRLSSRMPWHGSPTPWRPSQPIRDQDPPLSASCRPPGRADLSVRSPREGPRLYNEVMGDRRGEVR